MSNPDLSKLEIKEVTIEDYLQVLGDHCRRKGLEAMQTKLMILIATNASEATGATAKTIAEALILKSKPWNDRHRDAVYEFVYMNFPELVRDLYTPRVSTQEDMLVGAIASGVSTEQQAAIEGAAPAIKTRSQHPTMIDLGAREGGAIPVRGSLSGDRLPTMNYIEHPQLADKGGVADILEAERIAGEELAAKEAAARAAEEAATEALRKKALDEAAARTKRGKLDTLDSVLDGLDAAPARATEGSGDFLADEDVVAEGSGETVVKPVDLNGRETLAAVSDADLLEATEIARRRSAAMSVIDSEEEGVPQSDRVTAILPPEPK